MDWYLVRYFLAVAELGNFTRAAAQMNVTQPTLSAGIAKLEVLTGQRLFERDKRRVSITAAGSRFLPHARRIANEYTAALDEMSQTPKARRLRLGVLASIPTGFIEAAIQSHVQARPVELIEQVELIEGVERDLRARLEENRLDAALTIINAGERFEHEPLGWEDYVLIVPAMHRLARVPVIRAEELAQDVMIIRRHCEVLAATSRYFTERGVRPRFGLKTLNDDRALAMVRAGLGVTVVPESFFGPGLRQIGLADFDLRRQIGLLYAGQSQVSAAQSPFIGALRDAYARRQDERLTWLR
jgi:DNA-binding transcriptional LysR family regulator